MQRLWFQVRRTERVERALADLNLQLAYERWRHFSESGSQYDRSVTQEEEDSVDNRIARIGLQLTRGMEGITGRRASLFRLYLLICPRVTVGSLPHPAICRLQCNRTTWQLGDNARPEFSFLYQG
jgi:hypothetical protein